MYIPDRGDIVWLNFSPQSGHEQSGLRPALVVSPKEYNHKAGLGLFCPITSSIKGYAFEVKLPGDLNVNGVVLSDQIRSLDWRQRKAKFECKAGSSVIDEVTAKIAVLIFT